MGRMGLYELLTVTEAFKEQVGRDPATPALKRGDRRRHAAAAAGRALRVAEGLTTLEEVLSATPALD